MIIVCFDFGPRTLKTRIPVMFKRLAWQSAFFSLCLIAQSSFAGLQVAQTPMVDAPLGTVGLGAALRAGTSPYVGVKNVSSMLNDNSVDVIPLYLYEGEWLFARGTSIGVHIFNNDWLQVDAIASYRFDRLEPDANDYFKGLDEREQTVDAGFSLTLKNDWGLLSTTWLSDTMSHHNGDEVDVTYRYPWRSGRWSLSPFVSYIYQNSHLADYYYGIDVEEALADRPVYRAGSTGFWRAGVNTSYQLSEHLIVYSNIAFQQVDSEVYNSPLVDEKYLNTAVLGFAYMFGNVMNDSTKQPDSKRNGEWSWRLNAGYTAQESFLKVHRGRAKRNQDAHTYLGGLTLGKLLSDGKTIDYWGKFSANRRFENGFQNDFWEYNTYVMAMVSAYSSKTHQELLRYGFGFGFSYASQVPYVEQLKQAKRDKETSRFLNYLEAQLDVPFRVLFGKNASNNCYLGITLVHRSGIFGTSDILNNVSGGSDVVTGHVECKR